MQTRARLACALTVALAAASCTEPNPSYRPFDPPPPPLPPAPRFDGGAPPRADSACPAMFADEDGDGFGDPFRVEHPCGQTLPGFVARGGDCADRDPRAFPGQSAAFASARSDGSWDFDCDGQAVVQPAQRFGGCKRAAGRCDGEGWGDHIPGCGEPGQYFRCVMVPGGKDGSFNEPSCEPMPEQRVARCR